MASVRLFVFGIDSVSRVRSPLGVAALVVAISLFSPAPAAVATSGTLNIVADTTLTEDHDSRIVIAASI